MGFTLRTLLPVSSPLERFPSPGSLGSTDVDGDASPLTCWWVVAAFDMTRDGTYLLSERLFLPLCAGAVSRAAGSDPSSSSWGRSWFTTSAISFKFYRDGCPWTWRRCGCLRTMVRCVRNQSSAPRAIQSKSHCATAFLAPTQFMCTPN